MPLMSRRWLIAGLLLTGLSACGPGRPSARPEATLGGEADPELRRLIDRYADHYDVPRTLMHRVVHRESRYNPRARNRDYWGLMQIRPETARTMGHRGAPSELLDAETNLKYAGKYLRGAWMVADGSHDRAVRWYASGYYYEAKRRGLLRETGLRT